jgi:uncharacterized membrane protein YjjB (DUF3815 family)
MRLTNNALGFVINFLLGIAWASMFIGALSTFLSFYQEHFFFAIVSGAIAMLPGLIGVLLLEHMITSKEKYLELKKQTKLLKLLLETTQEK